MVKTEQKNIRKDHIKKGQKGRIKKIHIKKDRIKKANPIDARGKKHIRRKKDKLEGFYLKVKSQLQNYRQILE